MLFGRTRLVTLVGLLMAAVIAGTWSTGAAAQANDSTNVLMQAPTPTWQTLSSPAALIVRGHVVSSDSHGNADHTLIESRSTLAVRYTISGAYSAMSGQPEVQQLTVYTLGGELPDGFGMLASHEPALHPGEEVVLFLRPSPAQDAAGYALAGSFSDKILVQDGFAWGADESPAMPLEEFYTQLAGANLAANLPADWSAQEQAAPAPGKVSTRQYVYNNYKWPTNSVRYKVNVNTQQASPGNGSADDFLAAIRRAANTWTYVESADVNLVYGGTSATTKIGFNGANEIVFVDEGLSGSAGESRPLATAVVFYMNSTIVETDIKINDAYAWDATGSPALAEFDLQSVLLHEFGHWIGMGHDEDDRAVMYDGMVMGELKGSLFETDLEGIAAVYRCAAGQICNPDTPADPPFVADPIVMPTTDPTVPQPASPSLPGGEIYLPLVIV